MVCLSLRDHTALFIFTTQQNWKTALKPITISRNLERVLENVLGSIEGGRNFMTVSLTNHLTSQNASSKQKLTTKV